MAAQYPPPSHTHTHTDGPYKSEFNAHKTFMLKGKIYHNLIMYK